MPIGKLPYLRYRIINACLTNPKKRYPTLEDIKAALAKYDVAVSKRCIERDFESMRHDERLNYNARILYCIDNKGYYYEDPEFSIDKFPLTAREIETSGLIKESFKSFCGALAFNNVAGIYDKLNQAVMQFEKLKACELLYSIANFEHVPSAKGIEHFDTLYHAILQEHPLLVSYKESDKPAGDHIFHPYLLKEYKLRWYVLGYSECSKKKILLALDCIETLVNKEVPFKPYTGMDVQRYLDHTIGVTLNSGGVKEVQLWCSWSQGQHFKTQPLHATQKIVSDDATGLVLSMQLIINYELLQTLLAFGAEVKVLNPPVLQQQVKDMIMRGVKLYELNSA